MCAQWGQMTATVKGGDDTSLVFIVVGQDWLWNCMTLCVTSHLPPSLEEVRGPSSASCVQIFTIYSSDYVNSLSFSQFGRYRFQHMQSSRGCTLPLSDRCSWWSSWSWQFLSLRDISWVAGPGYHHCCQAKNNSWQDKVCSMAERHSSFGIPMCVSSTGISTSKRHHTNEKWNGMSACHDVPTLWFHLKRYLVSKVLASQ